MSPVEEAGKNIVDEVDETVFVTLMLTNSLIKLNIISLMQDEMLKKKDEKHLCKLQNHLCHLKCECQIKGLTSNTGRVAMGGSSGKFRPLLFGIFFLIDVNFRYYVLRLLFTL